MNPIEVTDKITQIALDNEGNYFQQGYLTAPLVVQYYGMTVEGLIKSMKARTWLAADMRQRDAGALQWCKEQLQQSEKQNETQS